METLSAYHHLNPLFTQHRCHQVPPPFGDECSLAELKRLSPQTERPTAKANNTSKLEKNHSKDLKESPKSTSAPESIVEGRTTVTLCSKLITSNFISTDLLIDEDTPEREYFMRCVVIGGSNTGKHALIESNFPQKQPKTTDFEARRRVSDFLIKTSKKFQTTKKYHFWVKTSAQNNPVVENIWRSYYKSANAIIFVYDVTKKDSFEDLRKEVKRVLNSISKDKFFGILVGTNSDNQSERAVKYQEAMEFGCENGFTHFWETNSSQEEKTPQLLPRLDSQLRLTFEAI